DLVKRTSSRAMLRQPPAQSTVAALARAPPQTYETAGSGRVRAEVAARARLVVPGAPAIVFHLRLGDLPLDAARHAQHERARRDHHVLRDHRAGADDRVLADAAAGEEHGAHPDQRVVADLDAVQHDAVADRDPRADPLRRVEVDVYAGVVLDVGLRTDLDERVVAADRHAEPDADVAAETHVADHGRVVRDHRLAHPAQAADHVGMDDETTFGAWVGHRYTSSSTCGQRIATAP